MTEAEHSAAEPAPDRADAAAEARGEERKTAVEKPAGESAAGPAEAKANKKQTAQRAS